MQHHQVNHVFPGFSQFWAVNTFQNPGKTVPCPKPNPGPVTVRNPSYIPNLRYISTILQLENTYVKFLWVVCQSLVRKPQYDHCLYLSHFLGSTLTGVLIHLINVSLEI